MLTLCTRTVHYIIHSIYIYCGMWSPYAKFIPMETDQKCPEKNRFKAYRTLTWAKKEKLLFWRHTWHMSSSKAYHTHIEIPKRWNFMLKLVAASFNVFKILNLIVCKFLLNVNRIGWIREKSDKHTLVHAIICGWRRFVLICAASQEWMTSRLVYMVPNENRERWEANFMIGLNLALRIRNELNEWKRNQNNWSWEYIEGKNEKHENRFHR